MSVIVPCHNYGCFLGRALTSALNQTRPPHEVIVVDDRSTDDTAQVAAQFPVRYLAVDFGNQARARTAGLARARGDAIALLDADNELFPNFLAKHVAALDTDPEAGWAYGDRWIRCEPGGDWLAVPEGPLVSGPFSLERLACDNYIDNCVVIRRTALADIGDRFPDETTYAEDYHLWLTLAERGWVGAYLPEPLFLYRVHGENASRSFRLLHPVPQPTPQEPIYDRANQDIRQMHQYRNPFWDRFQHAGSIHAWWGIPEVTPGRFATVGLHVAPRGRRDVENVRVVVALPPGVELRSALSLNDPLGVPLDAENAWVVGDPEKASEIVVGLDRAWASRAPGEQAGIRLRLRARPEAQPITQLSATPWWRGPRGATRGAANFVELRMPTAVPELHPPAGGDTERERKDHRTRARRAVRRRIDP